MAEDQQGSGADSDVKDRLSQMSGSKIRKQRRARAEEATASSAKREAVKAKAQADEHAKRKELEAEFAPVPVRPKTEAAPPADAGPTQKPPAKKPAAKKAATTKSVGPGVALLVGLVVGALPGLVMTLTTVIDAPARPSSVPKDATERLRDWLHCAPGDSGRWDCTTYDYDGNVTSTGTFVAGPGANSSEWAALAASELLVEDGWHEQKDRGTKTLYVQGVKLEESGR